MIDALKAALVAVLLAGALGLLARRLSFLVMTTAVVVGLRPNGLFRARSGRILGELAVALLVLSVVYELTFVAGQFDPQASLLDTFGVDLGFLSVVTTPLGTILTVIAVVLFLAATGFAGAMRLAEARALNRRLTDRRPSSVLVRFALFNADIVFLDRRPIPVWVRTELSCLGLAILTAASGGMASDREFTEDRAFRRLLGPSASTWRSVVTAAVVAHDRDLDECIEESLDLVRD